MPFNVPPGERLSRYIFHGKGIRRSDRTIRHVVFEPPRTGRLSVYWTSELAESEIWAICEEHVAPVYGKPVIGRADLNSLHVYAEDLSVEVTGIPHPRHAEVVGWSPESTRWRLQATKLAAASTFVESA